MRLSGHDRLAYVSRGRPLVSDRRLSRAWPPARALGQLFDHLIADSPTLDARDTLTLDSRSGLPVLTEFLRARTRIPEGGEACVERFAVDARVRRRIGRTCQLKVIVDRFDPGRSVFRRITCELTTTKPTESVELTADGLVLSDALRDTLYRFATADVELLYLRLNQLDHLEISEITAAQTGPLVTPWSTPPPALAEVRASHPGAMLLCCSSARAIADDDRMVDRNALEPTLERSMGAQAYGELRRAMPARYGLARDLSVIAEASSVAAAVRAALPGCVVWTARSASP